MSSHRLDVDRLALAVEVARSQRGISKRQVAREAGLAASAMTRLYKGRCPDVHGFLSLVAWLRTSEVSWFIHPPLTTPGDRDEPGR